MRVEEALHERRNRVTESPWRVRVSLFVAERVVLAMVGDPSVERPFDGEGSCDGQHHAHPRLGLERTMSEVTVETDGDPGGAERVEDHEQSEVDRSDEAAPRERDRSERQRSTAR